MEIGVILYWLLGAAVLSPLASFVVILLLGSNGRMAGRIATLAIFVSCLLSLASLAIWVWNHPPIDSHSAHASHETHGDEAESQGGSHAADSESDHGETAAEVADPREEIADGDSGEQPPWIERDQGDDDRDDTRGRSDEMQPSAGTVPVLGQIERIELGEVLETALGRSRTRKILSGFLHDDPPVPEPGARPARLPNHGTIRRDGHDPAGAGQGKTRSAGRGHGR